MPTYPSRHISITVEKPSAVYLIGCGLRGSGFDSSPSMIAICAERLPSHEWIAGGMRRAILGRTFNRIIA
jgi:trans-aconitate methyltransferase